jgi:hypothetical protein
MSTDPDRPAVPGLESADGRTRPLDPSQDPDRYDRARSDSGAVFDPDEHPRMIEVPEHPRVDPKQDPDRYLPPGQGQSLPDLLGKAGTHEGERDGYQWVFGLIGVFLFLALVAYLFSEVLVP